MIKILARLDKYLDLIKDYQDTMDYEIRIMDIHYNDIMREADKIAYRLQKLWNKFVDKSWRLLYSQHTHPFSKLKI